jgi:hypothetical protein
MVDLLIARLVLGHPERAVREQGLAVHEQRLRLRPGRAKAAEDRETVRVDVAPVVDPLVAEPHHLAQRVDAVSQAKDDQAVRWIREREPIDLVLGDEDPTHGRRKRGKLRQRDADVGKSLNVVPLIEDPKSDQCRLRAQPVA